MLRILLKKIDLRRSIIPLVEQMLPKFTQRKVLLIPVEVHGMDFEVSEKTKEYRKSVTLVFYAACNYVFVGLLEGNLHNIENGTKVERHSYHDSCWTTSGVEGIIRKFSEECFKELFEKDPVEKNWHIDTDFGIFGPTLIDGQIKDIDGDPYFEELPHQEPILNLLECKDIEMVYMYISDEGKITSGDSLEYKSDHFKEVYGAFLSVYRLGKTDLKKIEKELSDEKEEIRILDAGFRYYRFCLIKK